MITFSHTIHLFDCNQFMIYLFLFVSSVLGCTFTVRRTRSIWIQSRVTFVTKTVVFNLTIIVDVTGVLIASV